ncbi:MAG: DUF2723 domain-containing protein [Candidatus Hydrogenedentes bacterium]|nr:DUF2723 domain-containing protein [Candidatus Hydrogenedentota bacterium]
MSTAPDTLQPRLHVRLPRNLSPLDYFAGFFVFAVSLAVYIKTLAPTVYGEDSGELIAAADTLGIPHPTGYPLWCLLTKIFMTIVYAGDPAWRANLFSAMCGSAAAMCVAWIVCLTTHHRLAAIAAALSLAFSFEFWEQSVIAEVYALNALITAVCILLLLLWSESRRNILVYASGLLFGAGLANHQVLLLCAPAFAVYVLTIGGIRFRAWTMHLITLLLAFAGLAVYLYLPFRSMANPPMDWGNPETWPAFYDVVTRAQYQFIITDGPRSWHRFFEQAETFASIYLTQFTPGVGLLAPFGVFVLWKRGFRALSAMLLLAWFGTTIGGIVIPNFGADRLSIWLNTTYWIPAYLVSAICIGAAIAGISASIQRRLVRGMVLAGLVIAALGAPLLANYAHNDKGRFYLASDYARNILATLAPGAIYFGDSDLSLFPVMYYQVVEHMRTDVLIANPYGYPTENLYNDMPEEMREGFRKPIPTDEDEQRIFEWLVKTSGRPVYTTAQRRGEGILVYNEGLLYRYAPAATPIDPGSPWDRYTWHSLDESEFGDDWSAEVILSEYYFARGRADFDASRRASGLNAFERAANIARENKEMLNNLGCAAASYGLFDDAIRYFQSACVLDPEFHMARLNLGRAYMKKSDFARAKAEFDRVLVTVPADPAANTLSAYCQRQSQAQTQTPTIQAPPPR